MSGIEDWTRGMINEKAMSVSEIMFMPSESDWFFKYNIGGWCVGTMQKENAENPIHPRNIWIIQRILRQRNY